MDNINSNATRFDDAADLVSARGTDMRARLAALDVALGDIRHRPTVVLLEALDPPVAAARWIPELIAAAGGRALLVEAGQPALAIEWDDVASAQPEAVILALRGCDLAGAVRAFDAVAALPVWRDVPATYLMQIYAVDSAALLIPGPGLMHGIELLAGLLHPDRVTPPGPDKAARLNHLVQTPLRLDD